MFKRVIVATTSWVVVAVLVQAYVIALAWIEAVSAAYQAELQPGCETTRHVCLDQWSGMTQSATCSESHLCHVANMHGMQQGLLRHCLLESLQYGAGHPTVGPLRLRQQSLSHSFLVTIC